MLLITPTEVLTMAFMPREAISKESIRTLKIDIAEQQYILPRFGDILFEEFANGDHRAFVERYIKPALAFYVRASIINDLSVQITDRGAIIYGEKYSSQKENAANSTSKETQDSKGTDSVISQSNTSDSTAEASELYATTLETRSTNYAEVVESHPDSESESSVVENADTDTTTTKTVEQTATQGKDTTENRTKNIENSDTDTQKHSYERIVAATMEQRKALILNALCDANILVAKAVRYVERHSEEFPSYEPIDLSKRVFF